MSEPPVFVTIPASNYVEKARWALQLANISFTEDKHVPIFHRLATTPLGGTSVPLLYLPQRKLALTDSSDILNYCATLQPSLYPTVEAKQRELYFDRELGPAVRVIAYFALFEDSSLAQDLIVRLTTSRVERVLARILLEPFIRMFLFRFMSVNEQGVVHALDQVEQIAAEVNHLVGTRPLGSCFLAGDSFSAADISFCAHFGLLLAPPENIYIRDVGGLITDSAIRDRVARLQRSKAADFVSWCYKHKRPAMA